ncbi:MAG: M48 family metalloprotease [Chitinophagaceae bacterium]|nr:M48 family metalloprotease [Chitinophagaceae bacterium]
MLTPLPYHRQVRDYFRQQTKTWDYFALAKNKEEQLNEFKTELLKNTYKFDPVADQGIYSKIDLAKNKLGLTELPVTVYQAQYTEELNAAIVYINREAHIVFSGPVITLLTEEELLAVLAHELTHIKLYSLLDGELEIADRIITAIANNHSSEAAYYETARLFRLYTEIFCDRGALLVTGNHEPVITSLVKMSTGLQQVQAEAYLRQADEIFAADAKTRSAGISHPENFIRAKAVQLSHNQAAEVEKTVSNMVEHTIELDRLDIFQQQEMAILTRRFLQLFLKPRWIQSPLVISLARQYFADFAWDETAVLDAAFIEKLNDFHSSIKDYLAYVLFDFVIVDPSLDQVPAGWAFQFAEDAQLKEQLDAIVRKEGKLSDKKLQQHKQKSLAAYYAVKENEGEQIYE